MRFEQQISVCLKSVLACGAALALSGSGRIVFASGQTPVPAAPATQVAAPQPPSQSAAVAVPGPELQLSADEAVKLALENNLGIRAERLSPQAQALAVAQTRAAYAPVVFGGSTKNSNSNPPQNFLAGNNFVTNAGFRSTAGVAQQLKWFGGRYQASLDGARNTTSDPTDPFNPRLSSNFSFNFTQPLLRDLGIDSIRQQLLIGQKQQEIVDLQLQQQVTQTSRTVRNAYYDLIGAIGQLKVSQESLRLANESLKNNERRVEVGTIPPIDIVEAQAEVSRNEEAVIIGESQVKSFEDALRTLIMNPSQPDFWAVHIVPSEQPELRPRAMDVDAAISNALGHRTDIAQSHREMEQTDITMKFARNQKLPALNAIVNYGLAGVAGTRTLYDTSGGFPVPLGVAQRSFSDALHDIFGNDFKTWSVQFQVSYPIGTSAADAGFAQAKVQREQQMTTLRQLELQVTQQVREAARQVDTSLKRVEATRKAREFGEKRYEAEQKRINVGLSTTFQLFQAQRDLSSAQLAELNAILAYNRSLIAFESVQSVPPGR
ncbi:MAG: TolC family protein [Vicinamibacterales bacterium]